jgi:aminoglycoside phosphotransferase (APT) family kinase protein
VAYLVDDALVVRFAREDPAGVEREARLLRLLRDVSTIPIPEPLFADGARGWIAHRYLPGVPLLELEARAAVAERIGAALGRLLGALHAIPTERVRGLVDVDDQALDAWLGDARDLYASTADAIPADNRSAVERFLDTPPPQRGEERVFSHNDLGIEHVLVDPGTLETTGVIDWSDAALCDPAYDFGLVLRDLGRTALAAALDAYGAGDIEERAWFYARCALLEDLAYGIDTERGDYVAKSVDAVGWIF